MSDARTLNWRFIVPGEPAGLLFLPADGERLDAGRLVPRSRPALTEALAEGTYPAVVAVDAGGWSRETGIAPGRLLRRLAEAVEPGGYLCAGFPNPLYPARPSSRGSLGANRAERLLLQAGFEAPRVYLAFPGSDCPAYLVERDDPACIEYFVRHLAIPYAEGRGRSARARQHLLGLMRRAAVAAPHAMRARLAPAAVLVARRPR